MQRFNQQIGAGTSIAAGGPVKPDAGFTLVELLFALTILGALLAIAIPKLSVYRLQSQITRAGADLRVLDSSINTYKLNNDRLPPLLSDVYMGDMTDPWGNKYQYLLIEGNTKAKGQSRKDKFLVPINSDFDLYSMGPDGKSQSPLTAKDSQDDIIRANDGKYYGPASGY